MWYLLILYFVCNLNITVADEPSSPPTLQSNKMKYSAGDLINVTCVTQESYPAVNISWSLNNQTVRFRLLPPHHLPPPPNTVRRPPPLTSTDPVPRRPFENSWLCDRRDRREPSLKEVHKQMYRTVRSRLAIKQEEGGNPKNPTRQTYTSQIETRLGSVKMETKMTRSERKHLRTKTTDCKCKFNCKNNCKCKFYRFIRMSVF